MVNSINDGLNKPDEVTDGAAIQVIDFVASAGSVANVSFDPAFGTAPKVVVSVVGGIASFPSASAGSAVFNCVTASASGTIFVMDTSL